MRDAENHAQNTPRTERGLARPRQFAPAAALTCLMVVSATSLSGCATLADIFKAGMWVGVVAVVVLVGLSAAAIGLAKD